MKKARVQVASDADLKRAMNKALKRAGVTLEELRQQARQGRFSSEQARLAWFAISPIVTRSHRKLLKG